MEVETTQRSKPILTEAKDFYQQKDSCYIKIAFVPDQNGFRFEVRNELFINSTPETLPDEARTLSSFVRGMIEVAMANPHEVYKIGVRAQNNDTISIAEDIPDDHKELLLGEPKGRA